MDIQENDGNDSKDNSIEKETELCKNNANCFSFKLERAKHIFQNNFDVYSRSYQDLRR